MMLPLLAAKPSLPKKPTASLVMGCTMERYAMNRPTPTPACPASPALSRSAKGQESVAGIGGCSAPRLGAAAAASMSCMPRLSHAPWAHLPCRGVHCPSGQPPQQPALPPRRRRPAGHRCAAVASGGSWAHSLWSRSSKRLRPPPPPSQAAQPLAAKAPLQPHGTNACRFSQVLACSSWVSWASMGWEALLRNMPMATCSAIADFCGAGFSRARGGGVVGLAK